MMRLARRLRPFIAHTIRTFKLTVRALSGQQYVD